MEDGTVNSQSPGDGVLGRDRLCLIPCSSAYSNNNHTFHRYYFLKLKLFKKNKNKNQWVLAALSPYWDYLNQKQNQGAGSQCKCNGPMPGDSTLLQAATEAVGMWG